MELWMKIAWAVLIGMFIVMLVPQARAMVKNSRKGTSSEWISALLPIGLVGAFIVLLVLSVR